MPGADADSLPVLADDGDPGPSDPELAAPTNSWVPREHWAPVQPDTLLEGLTDPQREAVLHRGGPLLIVAGAGSGKTRVLTRRIAHLIATRDAAPWQILAITFTNKAADEMRKRVAELVGPRAKRMWVSTFHSACVRILRAHGDRLGYKGSFTIYDDADSRRLVEIVARELDLDTKKMSPRSVLGQISQAKSRQQGPDEYRAAAVTIFDRRIADVFDRYQQRMVAANAMDFDDLLLNAVRLFRLYPDVLQHYQTRFTHLLIDEYQDTNAVQNALAVLLAGEHRNIVVVGDSDQSVYRFRGADISNILDFEQAFPDATAIVLDQNFRSTQTILDAANSVITNNVSRKPKTLWTDGGTGGKIVRYRAEDERDEAEWVAHEIVRLRSDQELRWGDVAVFYRTNAQSAALEEALVHAEVPYRVVGGTRFYDRREIKDVMAYLKVLVNPDDEISWRRIVNVPKRGVGDTSVAKLSGWAGSHGLSFGDAVAQGPDVGIGGKAGRSLVELSELLEGLRARMILPPLVDENGDAVAPEDPGLALGGRGDRGGERSDPEIEDALGTLDPGELVSRGGGADGLPQRAPGRRHHRGTGAGRERRHLGGNGRRVPHLARVPGGRLPGGGLRPAGRGRHQGLADDHAHRQGVGVPGGLPGRHGGRHLPPHALARGSGRTGGGTPALLRGHHPRRAPPVRLARLEPHALRPGHQQHPEPVPGRDPRGIGPGRGRRSRRTIRLRLDPLRRRRLRLGWPVRPTRRRWRRRGRHSWPQCLRPGAGCGRRVRRHRPAPPRPRPAGPSCWASRSVTRWSTDSGARVGWSRPPGPGRT